MYPKPRAAELAKAAQTVVPALAVDVTDSNVERLKTAPIVAITPDQKEVPVAAAIQTTPIAGSDIVANAATVSNRSSSVERVVGTTGVDQTAQNARNVRTLPKTASVMAWVVLVGIVSLAAAFGLMIFGKLSSAPTL